MTILYSNKRFLDHDTGTHPESSERLKTVHARLKASRLWSKVTQGKVMDASIDQLASVHSMAHIDSVRQFAEHGGGRIEADTVVSPKSFDVAMLALPESAL